MDYPEGATPLDPDEMEGIKYPHIETRAELDQLEQQNIQDGFNWLSRQRKYQNFLNELFLRELHKQLFGAVWSWAGQYRKTEKNIGIDPRRIAVEVRKLLDDACFWIEHSVYPRDEFASRFHHRLVFIHPFPNGNGRHGRIMTDVILTHALEVPAIRWEKRSLDRDGDYRRRYINALRQADGGDMQPLIEFISAL